MSGQAQILKGKHVSVLCLTRAVNDTRICRQVQALKNAGAYVSVIAYGEPEDELGDECYWMPIPIPSWSYRLKIVSVHGFANILSSFSGITYRMTPEYNFILKKLLELKPDLIHANDWVVLMQSAKVKKKIGSSLLYDTHELAVEEHENRWLWRVISKKFVKAIERKYIFEADKVCTVSEGIADIYKDIYQMEQRPSVIRNIPICQEQQFRPSDKSIKILFHGLICPNRGIETLISSINYCSDRFELVIRGDGNKKYIDGLKTMISSLGLEGRVSIEGVIPQEDIVRVANQSDIGVVSAPITSRQYNYSLPNKFFEYIAAGLALCVSNGYEMSAIVKKYDLGLIFEKHTPQEFAHVFEKINQDQINQYKKNALKAYQDLNWENESIQLMELYKEMLLEK